MNKLKQLNEKKGAARKAIQNLTEDRASKLTELEAAMIAEQPDQDAINTLKSEIEAINQKITNNNTLIDSYEHQIADLADMQNTGGDAGFAFDGFDNKDQQINEASKYSLVKALREANSAGGPAGLTGLEKEMHQEAINDAKQKGIKLTGNVHLPQVVVEARTMRNDLTATGGSGGDQGGLTVATEKMPLIDILKAKLPFVDSNENSRDGLGATFFTDLQGNISFPRAVEGSDQDDKAESASADEITATFGELALSPTRLPSVIEVTEQLLTQSSVDVENWLRSYLMYKTSKVMHSNIITDILGASGTNAQSHGTNGGAEDWASLVAYETDVLAADAANEDEPRLGWLTNSAVRGKLKTTVKESGQAIYLYEKGLVNEYPMFVSSLVPNDLTKGTGEDLSANIFANWASLYIAMWGGFSFLVNPYTKDDEGIIRINASTYYDSGLRHAEAFSVGKDIITS